MSMGEEETKGNELTKEVHEVLKDSSLNFIGNVEGHDLFTGKVDVIVMDGFTGNVALKASETPGRVDHAPHPGGADAHAAAQGWGPGSSTRRLPRRPAAASTPRSTGARPSWA